MKATAVAAFVGAIGLSVGGAAHAMAQPAPQNPALPANLTLPPQLHDLARDILPPHMLVPGPGRAVAPASGTVTSGFGPRWGASHNGVDIANKIGTPVYAVTDGVVLESGPASGFGQWIRVRQDDGTTGVFGHVDQSFVRAGQQVHAGQQIGTVGNRGESTGPHLHYEVWDKGGKKIDPQIWLNKRDVHP
ncbi:peptidoglycan DD-metalloendopeptidase family protein [Gordonia sp. SID5947]|uniref:M23 family metallopeptidase n=1 Tax=Gordonia sp. SID5947 TaxID=2690315 RepID=UPI00136B8F4D|nr:M23 family metallopeptidase [Gordonia sp. SID5947]MYR05766.1 peptidoglycan DD-metalloendopeptidase family protein [Gordonia sp. SID5947]